VDLSDLIQCVCDACMRNSPIATVLLPGKLRTSSRNPCPTVMLPIIMFRLTFPCLLSTKLVYREGRILARAKVIIEGFGRITLPLKFVPSASAGSITAAFFNENSSSLLNPRFT